MIVAIYDETLEMNALSKLATAGGFSLEDVIDFAARSGFSSDSQNLTEWIEQYADWALTRYSCQIYSIATGVLLATLPMRSFQGRMRLASPDYISAVISGDELFSQIESWVNDGAHLVVRKRLELQGQEGLDEEIARVVLERPRVDKGGTRTSMTLYGYRSSPASNNTVQLPVPKIFSVVQGSIRATFAEVDLYLRTGDTVEIPGQAPFRVSTISYVVSADGTTGMTVGQEIT